MSVIIELNAGSGVQSVAGGGFTPRPLSLTLAGGAAQVGSAYNGSFVAVGGVPPYTYSISVGVLPAGLSLNTGTGAITGTPTAAGSVSFTGMVTDSASTTATIASTVVVNGTPEQPYAVLLTELGPRSLDGNQQTRTILQVVVQELIAGVLGTKLTVQWSSNNGVGWETLAIVTPDRIDEDGTHTYYQTTLTIPNVLVLTTAQNWKAQAWAANTYADPGMMAATVSSTLVVAAIGVPSATGATLSITSAVNAIDPTSGEQVWNQTITIQTPGTGDPNCWAYQITVQQCNAGGTGGPSGDPNEYERPWTDFPNDGNKYTFTLEGTYEPTNTYTNTDYKVYGFSRSATATPAWQDSTYSVKQHWPSTLNYNIQSFGNIPASLLLITTGANLIVNPGFESGLLGWAELNNAMGMQFQSDATVNHTADGSRCLEVNAIVNGASTDVSQIIIAEANRQYYLSIWMACDAGAQFNWQLVAYFYDATGAYIGASVVTGGTTGGVATPWSKFGNPTAVTPSNCATIGFQINLSCTGGTGNIHFDDVSAYLLPATTGAVTLDSNGNVIVNTAGPLSIAGNAITMAAAAITSTYLAAASVTAAAMAANSVTAANSALAANSVVNANMVSVAISKVTYGTVVFAGDVVISRGISLPVITLQSSNGITLFGQADASTGTTGLLTLPYVNIESGGILVYGGGSGGAGPSVTIGSSTINLWSSNGNSSDPYITMSALGGITLRNSLFQTVITAASIQLEYNGTPYISLTSSGMTLASGTVLTAPTITGGAITGATMALAANGITTTVNNTTHFGYPIGLLIDDGTYCSALASQAISLVKDSSSFVFAQMLINGTVGQVLLNDSAAGGGLILQPIFTTSSITGGGALTIPTVARAFMKVICTIGGTTTTYNVALI